MGADQSTPQKQYRSGKRPREDDRSLERALQLMESQDYNSIASVRFPQIKGPVSWAKLGEYARPSNVKLN